MISWKVENNNRLLAEVKNKFLGIYTSKDLRWTIEHNHCFVNDLVERFCSVIVNKNDHICIWIETSPAFAIEKSRILYEDVHIFVYDKPPFLTSEELAKITYCRLVHRLDRDTSGVILLAKTQKVQTALEEQFRRQTIKKEYLALVEGLPNKSGIISGNMTPRHQREGAVIWGMSPSGLWSQTHWICLQNYGNHTLILCLPITGRTHQIRVHLQYIDHPIIGDYIYGSRHKKEGLFRPLLHAYRLTFSHPITREKCIFSAPLPLDFGIQNFKYPKMHG